MAATQQVVIVDAPTPQVPTHEQIASLAHALWLERGCTEGSAEADWLWAEQELLRQAAKRPGEETRNKRKNGRSNHSER
jgi:hypothetical protein